MRVRAQIPEAAAPTLESAGSAHAIRAEYWSLPAEVLVLSLGANTELGLDASEVVKRLLADATHLAKPSPAKDAFFLLLTQFKSPIVIILISAAILSAFLQDATDATIIIAIIMVSGLLGFFQEHGAANAVQKLLALVEVTATCVRGGSRISVRTNEVVPGDILIVAAGDVIPADCRILESHSLFANEAALTGETFPAEKAPGVLTATTPLSGRTNCLLMGTDIVSGSGKAVVVYTGRDTEFGHVSSAMTRRSPETDFERGIRRFGYLLMEVTLLFVLLIFAANVYFHRPVLESFEFSLALAVGLTPQLLPAIISINLSHGAKRMAAQKVIVKRLSAIENFGSMDVLCTDKTGTLTEGTVKVHAAVDIEGKVSDSVLRYAALNSTFQTGYANPIDQAIIAFAKSDTASYSKLDEEPYDFARKRLSVLISGPLPGGRHVMITKGALSNILEICTFAISPSGECVPLAPLRASIEAQYKLFSGQGFRTLGIAVREMGALTKIGKVDEAEMALAGFIVLFDPLQTGIVASLESLRRLGISLKIITGDNALVASIVSQQAGIPAPGLLTGAELHNISEAALHQQVSTVDVFAEVEPSQKERIIRALMNAGHVVGYMGDGINDASALHVADVGISVANAVDVAKQAADIVLLEKDLSVLASGVREGRVTFANTLKYVFMATSANFGNMFSMAGASLFLPFLPLLPKQVLLTNLMTDFPAMTIATDNADSDMVDRPRRWDIGFIRRFMILFGLISSVFDYVTFGILLRLMHVDVAQFRTGWFVESVASATLIVLVIRTRKRFYASRPSQPLLWATISVVAAVAILPYTPLAGLIGFVALPLVLLPMLGVVVLFYVGLAEAAKAWFYRSEDLKIRRN